MSIKQKILVDLANTLSEFNYHIWKDIDEVKHALDDDKDVELDIIALHSESMMILDKLNEIGFINFENIRPSYKHEVYHSFNFINGSYIHIHLYSSLVSGSHYSKEYDLNSYVCFDDYYTYKGFKLASKELEELYSVLRVITKKKNRLEKIKQQDINNFNKFSKENKYYEVDMQKAIKIDSLRYKSKSKIYLENLYYKFCYRIHCKVFKLSNKKCLINKSIAFVGTDGSGKTTISDIIYKNMKRKVPVVKVYLGSSKKNYSIRTWISYILYYFFFRLFKIFGVNKVYTFGLANFELSRLRDTFLRYKKSKKSSHIKIYERFPIPGFLDYPNKLDEELNNFMLPFQIRRLKFYRDFWCEENKGCKIFLISTPLEQIKMRREMDESEFNDIYQKKSVEAEFLLKENSKRLVTISNDLSLEETLSEIYEKL